MRTRLIGLAVVAVIAGVPVLANVCDLECQVATRPSTPSCHDHGEAAQPTRGPTTPKPCAHDHVTLRTALQSPVLTLAAIGAAVINATLTSASAPAPAFAGELWRPARSSLRSASSTPRPLRI